jgi:anti-sigma B factor antagonist
VGPTWGCLTAFSITVSAEGDAGVARLTGELDILDADHARATLVAISGSTVVADLSGLTFVDARGVAAIVEAGDAIHARGNDLRIVGARGLVRRVFEICGLGDRLG